jgi:hypothetical protein
MGQGGDGRQVGVLGGLLKGFRRTLGFQLLRGVAKTCLRRNACRFSRLLGELKHVQPCESSYRLIHLRARLTLLLRLCFRPEHSLEPHYGRMADLRLEGPQRSFRPYGQTALSKISLIGSQTVAIICLYLTSAAYWPTNLKSPETRPRNPFGTFHASFAKPLYLGDV